jgi:hypothetical protein
LEYKGDINLQFESQMFLSLWCSNDTVSIADMIRSVPCECQCDSDEEDDNDMWTTFMYETTAFHVTNYENSHYIEIITLQLRCGADLYSHNCHGDTILHTVLADTEFHNETIFKFLLDDCQADYPNIQNHDGLTAWDIGMNIKLQCMTDIKNYNDVMEEQMNQYRNHKKLYKRMEQKRRQQFYSLL